jgi:hypothetical protein
MEAVEAGSDSRVRGAALPKARQWLQWLAYHEATLPGGEGWIDCLRDTALSLHHQIASAARRLRGNPVWDLQGTMTDDTAPLEDGARRLLVQLERLNRRDVPVRFTPWLECLLGACRQQVRLAREIDDLRAGMPLQVDVSVDAAARRLIEVG